MNPKFKGYAPFHADGRLTLGADDIGLFGPALYGSKPLDVRVYQARRLIDELRRFGCTHHSALGSMLWVALAWMSANQRQFQLEIHKEMRNGKDAIIGYTVWLDRKPLGVV